MCTGDNEKVCEILALRVDFKNYMWDYKYIKSDGYYQGYFSIRSYRVFNGVKVLLEIARYDDKTAWVYLSSGKKRKQLLNYQEKQTKNKGCGMELLIWVKRELTDTFPKYYSNVLKKQGIVIDKLFISPSNSRLMRIYKKGLLRDGYNVTTYKGVGQVLFKKV